jgi:transposase-like protein
MGKRGRAPKYDDVFCTNRACSLYGKTKQGNIVSNGTYPTKSGRVRKFICRTCGNIFNGRTGTVFFDLRTPEDTVILAIKLLLKGMSVRGIGEVLGSKPDTILSWLQRAAEHSEQVDAFLLRDLKVKKVELDELWTFVKKKRLREWKKKRASFGYG